MIDYTRYMRNHQSNILPLSNILCQQLEVQPNYLLYRIRGTFPLEPGSKDSLRR